MSVIERKDERSWRLSGDPVRVDIGPAVFPGCAVDAVPVNELRRVEQQLREAVEAAEKATALAERYGEAVAAISAALPNEIRVRAIIASLDTGGR